MVEEVESETESKSEVLTSSESLYRNKDPPSRREPEMPVRVTYADIRGLWTSNSAYYPYKLPPVFPNGSEILILRNGRVKKWRKLSKLYCPKAVVVDNPLWKTFSYFDLAAATDNFIPENLLGKGAMRRLALSPSVCPSWQPCFCAFGSDECLDWKTRYKVATGIAEGLKYLHHDCPKRIIHRDITASNILLTEDYEAHISDFGLAKWLPENWHQHVVYPIEGTLGYLAPEYFMHGIVDEKTDVFAFGVLLLEILTGRRAVDSSRQSLVIWGKPLLEKNKVKELVDPRLEGNYDQTEVKRAMLTAFLCINHLAKLRPSMSRVVELLKNEAGHRVAEGLWRESSYSRRL
ncbi:Receptor-like cytosolic serine/threonine-protein kinase RBK1 [Hibiscus syriacus]|uniref:non-specific serine/threonine protein kinase n=1 Tax=Hibiscus syriacus TaxID=106335 RepID=A0A6A3APW9_HIBSY|nr:Receptor-like cytosolic serine/threonine-protein kinase RBK1 [Hibiscus syriacus]